MDEIPLRDPRLRRLLHKLLDYDLEQYSALLNLFGPEGVLREFPIRDRRLRQLLNRILDHDPEQYIELVQAALVLYDYEGGHPEEREILFEGPIVLNELLTVDEERARAGLSGPDEPAASAAGPSPEPARPADPEIESGPGNAMTFLSRRPLRNSASPVHALLSLEEPEALQAAIHALEPEDAALAIGQAPSLEEKSRLIWALTPERRAEVLAQLHPGFIGTLIQHQEAGNQALLGDLSREQFTRLLGYCSPERAYSWITMAASFEHGRANLLPLPIPISDLAAAMLTQPEFETHSRQIADYVEDLGLDMTDYRDLAAALVWFLGAEGMLRDFPLRDHRLRQLCQTILDHDPECYGQLLHTALQLSDHAVNHPEEQMTLLSRSPLGDPESPVQALLSIEEPQALQAAINALEPEDAALAVGQAPSVEEKSRLVWALEPERRAEVLDQLHPGMIGALIQNQEAENKALLGDLSREQFTRLLRFCSPERAYYWLTLATSFEDARANMLPLLVPVGDLAAALLTQPEFETHCQEIGDYSVEGLGLELAELLHRALSETRDLAFAIVTVFGADGMLREFPIRDRRLRQICQMILDYAPEHYVELIHVTLQLSDYQGNHSEEQEVLREEPVLLDHVLSLEEERSRTGLAAQEGNAARPAAADIASVPSLPARQSAELMRTAAAALPAQRQNELSQEMQLLFLQEAAYAGGSFLQADLEQAAERVQSYVQLGLAGLSEGRTEQAAQLLREQRLRTLMESGARQVERLRQVALRLEPWHEVLDKEQIRLLEGLVHPDLGIEEESHRPVLRLRKAPRSSVVESIDLETARGRLEAIDAWIALVRAVGKARILRRKRDADTDPLTRDLLVAAVLYRLWDPALVEAADRARFRSRYLDAETGRWSPAAYRALAEALQTLARDRKLGSSAVEKIARLLAHSLDDMAAAPL
jgi:hypothetical protein